MESIEEICKKIVYLNGKTRPVCQYCGKPFTSKKIPEVSKNLSNIRDNTEFYFWVSDCECLEKIREQEQAEKEKELERQRIENENRLKEEQQQRDKERIERIFNNSMITPFFRKKRFENFEKTENIKFCQEYANNFDKETSKGLWFIGYAGTGKTTALACICNQLMEQGHPCLFTTFSSLLNKFSNYSYEHAGDIFPLLEDLTKVDFVVLDDLGRETYTDKRKEFAFMIIDHLMNYEIKTAITANPDILSKLAAMEEWQAIFDRLRIMCPVKIQFKGDSMRGGNG